LETPFPRGELRDRHIVAFYKIPQQHLEFADNIKRNRAHGNLDCIVANNDKLINECVWCQFDTSERWFCMFALNIDNWKALAACRS
jgi:hypothetical protein